MKQEPKPQNLYFLAWYHKCPELIESTTETQNSQNFLNIVSTTLFGIPTTIPKNADNLTKTFDIAKKSILKNIMKP
jgi:hypothetical protein